MVLFKNRNSKMSGFQKIPDFEWSDFGSPLYSNQLCVSTSYLLHKTLYINRTNRLFIRLSTFQSIIFEAKFLFSGVQLRAIADEVEWATPHLVWQTQTTPIQVQQYTCRVFFNACCVKWQYLCDVMHAVKNMRVSYFGPISKGGWRTIVHERGM